MSLLLMRTLASIVVFIRLEEDAWRLVYECFRILVIDDCVHCHFVFASICIVVFQLETRLHSTQRIRLVSLRELPVRLRVCFFFDIFVAIGLFVVVVVHTVVHFVIVIHDH